MNILVTTVAAAVCVLTLSAGAPTQEPPAAAAPTPQQLERARDLLDKHAARSRDVQVLVADYVQRRTTALTKEPLQSKGRFLFVREPAAVLFFATEPRVSTIRLTAKTYEVHRPAKKQLERFHLDRPELAEGLFAAVGGDVARLRADFDVAAVVDRAPEKSGPEKSGPEKSGPEKTRPEKGAVADDALVHVRLVPKTKEVREQLQELIVTLREKDGALAAVAYRDHGGDLVEIELRAVEANPKQPPPATLDVPKDTTVVEHSPGKKPS